MVDGGVVFVARFFGDHAVLEVVGDGVGGGMSAGVAHIVVFSDCRVESLSAFAIFAITRTSSSVPFGVFATMFGNVKSLAASAGVPWCTSDVVCMSPCRSLRVRVARNLCF